MSPEDMKYFRSATGSLLYLSRGTRPDITHSVMVLAKSMSKPGPRAMIKLKRVLRYLKGTMHIGITHSEDSEDGEMLTAYEIMPSLVGSEMCIRDSHDTDLPRFSRSLRGARVSHAEPVKHGLRVGRPREIVPASMFRWLLKSARVAVAHPPMPQMRVRFCAEYLRGFVKACTVEDDIHHIHPRYFGGDGENVFAAS